MKVFSTIILLLLASSLWGHGIAERDYQALMAGGNLAYLRLGTIHMLTGYDHLLFLLGVIFFLTGFKDIFKYITAFTLGHSLTLVFATWLKISANSYLVDAVIALSVCYKGFDNLEGFPKILKIQAPHLLSVIFLFGLVHGFGLSTRLQQVQLGQDGMILRILSFNVGIEIGQILALSMLMIFLVGLRKTSTFQVCGRIINLGLVLVGGLLFLMQLHAYIHTEHPESFGFDEETHFKIHQDMESMDLESEDLKIDSVRDSP